MGNVNTPTIRRFKFEDYAGAPEWFATFLEGLNLFTDPIYQLVDGNLLYANMAAPRIYTVTAVSPASGNFTLSFANPLKIAPTSVLVGNIYSGVGSNHPSLTSLSYGSMNAYNIAETITVLAPDAFYQITPGLSAGSSLLNMTFQNARELKIGITGVYLINWNLGVRAASNNQEIEGTVMIDGVANTNFANHCEVINSTRPAALGGTGILALNANQLVSLCVSNHTAANNIVIEHVTCSVTQLQVASSVSLFWHVSENTIFIDNIVGVAPSTKYTIAFVVL